MLSDVLQRLVESVADNSDDVQVRKLLFSREPTSSLYPANIPVLTDYDQGE